MIRRRTERDLVACVRLMEESHRADGYPTHWPSDPTAWLSPRGLIDAWVAQGAELLVGHVVLCVSSGVASISRLAVARAARRVGVGGALFDTACDHAAGRGLQPVLEVVETNTAALALYESRGWYRLRSERWSDAPAGEPLLLHQYAAPQR